jgi:SAM-dependent methyltransferase
VRPADAVIWHDVECAAYEADLPLWRELASVGSGPVLDLGCGTGRVTLDLAERGNDVTGLDADPELVAELGRRARARGLRMRCHVADVRSFELDTTFGLAIAPMQVVQLLGGPSGRESMLRSVHRHLRAGGLVALALADPFDEVPVDDARPPLPDMREENGWVYSSTPVAVRSELDGAVTIDRLRQAISPSGELSETAASVRLDAVAAGELEAATSALGFRPRPARHVPATESYVGSTVVLLEAA